MLKLNVTSDLHGILPSYVEEFDLMLICGDVCPAHDHYYGYQKEWIENEFVEWINNLPFNESWSKVIMTPGNHDFIFEKWKENDYEYLKKLTNGRLIVLRNQLYIFDYIDKMTNEVDSLKIFGTPYCRHFGRWAFMRDDEILEDKFSEIPENIDILISHSAPDIETYGVINDSWHKKNAGCPYLAEAIKEKKPKYAFCGHIHSGNHKLQKIGDTMIANVSLCNEQYDDVNNILKLYI